MSHSGDTKLVFNEAYFDSLGRSSSMDALLRSSAEEVLKIAQLTAPLEAVSYKNGLKVEPGAIEKCHVQAVVGADPNTLLVEAQTGNLVRAVRLVRNNGESSGPRP